MKKGISMNMVETDYRPLETIELELLKKEIDILKNYCKKLKNDLIAMEVEIDELKEVLK